MKGMRLIPGDCLTVIPHLVAEGFVVDAVVTDPPYHLTSGNAAFDWAALGPRGSKRPNIGPTNGSGRGHKAGFMGQRWDGGDIAFRPETWAAIGAALKPGGYLLAFGGTRTHHRIWCAIEDAGFVIQDTIMWVYGAGFPKGRTQLKPAFEPICVAYKPGGKRTLQIDECRIPTDAPRPARSNERSASGLSGRGGAVTYGDFAVRGSIAVGETSLGRWPANVCHDSSDEVMAAFAAFGNAGGGFSTRGSDAGNTMYGDGKGLARPTTGQAIGFGDTGTAARFFYCAKADGEDRWGSKHPTVKPVELIRWLVRLITPPKGTVLDCFAGSGTTAVAAMAESRNAILIERDAEYIADMRERIAHYEGVGRHSLVMKNRNRKPGDLPLFADLDLPANWQELDSLGSWRVAIGEQRARLKDVAE